MRGGAHAASPRRRCMTDDAEWAAVVAYERARLEELCAHLELIEARLRRIEHVTLLDTPCEPEASKLAEAREALDRIREALPRLNP